MPQIPILEKKKKNISKHPFQKNPTDGLTNCSKGQVHNYNTYSILMIKTTKIKAVHFFLN